MTEKVADKGEPSSSLDTNDAVKNNTSQGSSTSAVTLENEPPNYATVDPVVPGEVYISSFKGASDKELMKKIGITHILTIGHTMDPMFPHDFVYKVVPIEDVEFAMIYSEFQSCFEFVDNAIQVGGRVLVHCEGGVSRSATVCIAYLMFKHPDLSVEQATKQVRMVRPFIAPNQGFLRQLSIFEELQRNPNTDDTIVKKELMRFQIDFEDRARSSSRALHQDLFNGPDDSPCPATGKSRVKPTPFPSTKPRPSNLLTSQVKKQKEGTKGEASPSKLLGRSSSNPTNVSPSSRRRNSSIDGTRDAKRMDSEFAVDVSGSKPESPVFHKGLEKNGDIAANVISTPVTSSRSSLPNSDTVSRSISQLGNRTDLGNMNHLNPLAERGNPFDLITSPLAKENDSSASTVTGPDQLEQIVAYWMQWLEHKGTPTQREFQIIETCYKAFGYLVDQMQTFARCCEKSTSSQDVSSQDSAAVPEIDSEYIAARKKTLAQFGTMLWAKRHQCEGSTGAVKGKVPKSLQRSEVSTAGESEANMSEVSSVGQTPNHIISSLLLFASLGLHNFGDHLSDMAYYRLSQLLRASDKDQEVVNEMDIDIVIELLNFTEYYILATGEQGLHNSRIVELQSIFESRVALLVDEDNVDTICDCLLEDPLAAKGSLRRLITYTMQFVHACISTDICRAQDKSYPSRISKRRLSRSAASPTQDDSSTVRSPPSSPEPVEFCRTPPASPAELLLSRMMAPAASCTRQLSSPMRQAAPKTVDRVQQYPIRPRAQTRVARLRHQHNTVAEPMLHAPVASEAAVTSPSLRAMGQRALSVVQTSEMAKLNEDDDNVLPDELGRASLHSTFEEVQTSPKGAFTASSLLRSMSPPPRLKSHGSEGTDSTAGAPLHSDSVSLSGLHLSVDDSFALSPTLGLASSRLQKSPTRAKQSLLVQRDQEVAHVLGTLPLAIATHHSELPSLPPSDPLDVDAELPPKSFEVRRMVLPGPAHPMTPDSRKQVTTLGSPRFFGGLRQSPPRLPGTVSHLEANRLTHRTWHAKELLRSNTTSVRSEIGRSMLVDPVKALQGILTHLMTSIKTKLRLHKTGIRTFKNTTKLEEKLAVLTKQAKQLPMVHPLVMVADNESRQGLNCLPKASNMLWEKIAEHPKKYGRNQTPYVFDCVSKVLVVFPPSDHDTSLQLPDDTSAKFRQIIRSAFELAPLGGEDALLRLTESATLSQHASAGYALTTDLNYVDRIFGTSYAEHHQLGDEMDGRRGTVTGGYLRFVPEDCLVEEQLVSQDGMEKRDGLRGCFHFTEESGHYGIRWTTLDNSYETFSSFMHASGFQDGEFLIQPYVKSQPTALEVLGHPGDGEFSGNPTERVKAMDLTLAPGVSVVSDSEWSFSDDEDS